MSELKVIRFVSLPAQPGAAVIRSPFTATISPWVLCIDGPGFPPDKHGNRARWINARP